MKRGRVPGKKPGKAGGGKRFYLMLPADLEEKIAREAKALGSQRSAAQHVVVMRLRDSFAQKPPRTPEDLDDGHA